MIGTTYGLRFSYKGSRLLWDRLKIEVFSVLLLAE